MTENEITTDELHRRSLDELRAKVQNLLGCEIKTSWLIAHELLICVKKCSAVGVDQQTIDELLQIAQDHLVLHRSQIPCLPQSGLSRLGQYNPFNGYKSSIEYTRDRSIPRPCEYKRTNIFGNPYDR